MRCDECRWWKPHEQKEIPWVFPKPEGWLSIFDYARTRCHYDSLDRVKEVETYNISGQCCYSRETHTKLRDDFCRFHEPDA
jgi:hypothetical protein